MRSVPDGECLEDLEPLHLGSTDSEKAPEGRNIMGEVPQQSTATEEVVQGKFRRGMGEYSACIDIMAYYFEEEELIEYLRGAETYM